MTAPILESQPARRRLRLFIATFSLVALALGLTAVALQSNTNPASAATVSFSQCNNRAAGPGGAPLTVTCSVSIINTIDANGGTSQVVFQRNCTLNACTGDIVNPSDVINAVHQCNGSDNVGGSTTICSVDIVNNISADSPAAATAITVSQCVGSGGGGGTNMNACVPSSQGSPTVTQCNGSGNGGGGLMTCTASGTTSAAFPVTVDQCNGSENGGGSFVTCTTTISTNLIDTSTPTSPPTTTPGGGTPGGGTPGGGTPGGGTPGGGTPGGGTPGGGTPGGGTPGSGTPGSGIPTGSVPSVPAIPTAPPPVVIPPAFTG
jgi:hypothetical protein